MTADERHNYEYRVNTTSESGPATVVRMVGQQKRVAEIGCGPGSITKILATQGNCKVTGLEIDADAIEKARPYCEQIFQADLNSPDWPRLLESFERYDVVLAADVLEHLYDPWTALQRMVALLSKEGYLVISLPHVGHAGVMGCLMDGDFAYHDWGLLDRTHIRFFCLKNMEAMFAQAKLKIIDVGYVTKHPLETEFADKWLTLSEPVKEVLLGSAYASIFQVVIKAVPLDYSGDAVALVAPSPHYKSAPVLFALLLQKRFIYLFKKVLLKIAKHLSPAARAKFRKALGQVGINI